MGRKEFFQVIDQQTQLRVSVTTDKGRVTRFLVQLEILLADGWSPVARYDTHHGFAHLDMLHPHGTTDKIRLVARNFNEALQIAFAELLTNWERYVENYIKES